RAARVPERRVDDLRVLRVELEVNRAHVVALEENLLPGLAAVARAEDAALRVRAVGVAERGDEDGVGVLRVNDHWAYLPRAFEPDVRPGAPGVRGLVHPVAVGNLRAHVGLARADVDDRGAGRRDADGADGGDRLRV